jgi:hypothetical protein
MLCPRGPRLQATWLLLATRPSFRSDFVSFSFRYEPLFPRPRRGGTPVETGTHPPTSHPGGQTSDTIIPNSGKRSSEEAAPIWRTEHFAQGLLRQPPPRFGQVDRTPTLFVYSLRRASSKSQRRVRRSSFGDQAGFSTAPSGRIPFVAKRHKAINNLRASATSSTFFSRPLAPDRRSLNHFAKALSG